MNRKKSVEIKLKEVIFLIKAPIKSKQGTLMHVCANLLDSILADAEK